MATVLKYFFYSHRLLFADYKNQDDLVDKLFMQSGVTETLRAQQLTMEQFDELCQNYETMFDTLNDQVLLL